MMGINKDLMGKMLDLVFSTLQLKFIMQLSE